MFEIKLTSTEHNVLSTEDALSAALENMLFEYEARIIRLRLVGKTRFYASIRVRSVLGTLRVVAIMGYCKTETNGGYRRTKFHGIHEDDASVSLYDNCPAEVLDDLDDPNTFKSLEWRKAMTLINHTKAIKGSVSAGDVLFFPKCELSVSSCGSMLRVAVCLKKNSFEVMTPSQNINRTKIEFDKLPSMADAVLIKKSDLKLVFRGQVAPGMSSHSGYFFQEAGGDSIQFIGRSATDTEESHRQTLIEHKSKFISRLLNQKLWFM